MIKDHRKWQNLLENLFVVILAFYPLRHIGWGLDLWDTGYSYANFQYMGTEHMDSMWLFSTYLATAVGHLLMKLPRADTLMGMNLYTGLIVSALTLTGYFFCTKKLRMPKIIVFLGEWMAMGLCWCPTASLYNYLTYLFFLGAFLLLYCGLAAEGPFDSENRRIAGDRFFRKQSYCLMGAGFLLGMNVLVRFANLPEAAMIVAVWAYDVILWLEEKGGKGQKETAVNDGKGGKGFWSRLVRHTFWCLAGYIAALAVLYGYIHIRYGIGEYIGGIRRLFAMTENASDYKATSMVQKILDDYVENLYWVLRIGIIAVGALFLCWLAGRLEMLLRSGRGAAAVAKKRDYAAVLHTGVRILIGLLSAAMLGWLYCRGFCSLMFYSYDSMRRPGILFLMLTTLIGVIRIFDRNSSREEKLLSGMIILVIQLTSIGSNNGTYPSMNNLFVAAPYTLWESWRFVRGRRQFLFPLKGLLLAFLGMCLFQFSMFGASFVFAEATGVQNATAYVENNAVLKNIRMNPEKAQWMTELGTYINDNELEGTEVLLYGWIPALSYYLQMPSAFNPWSDLDSYTLTTMKKDMGELEEQIREDETARPVIILENTYALYAEGRFDELAAAGSSKEQMEKNEKWQLITDFMADYGYTQVFRNAKFAVYR